MAIHFSALCGPTYTLTSLKPLLLNISNFPCSAGPNTTCDSCSIATCRVNCNGLQTVARKHWMSTCITSSCSTILFCIVPGYYRLLPFFVLFQVIHPHTNSGALPYRFCTLCMPLAISVGSLITFLSCIIYVSSWYKGYPLVHISSCTCIARSITVSV